MATLNYVCDIGSANNGTRATHINIWYYVNGYPAANTVIWDFNCGPNGYLCLYLTPTGAVRLGGVLWGVQFDVDSGVTPATGVWRWASAVITPQYDPNNHTSQNPAYSTAVRLGIWSQQSLSLGSVTTANLAGTFYVPYVPYTYVNINGTFGVGVKQGSVFANNTNDQTILTFAKPEFNRAVVDNINFAISGPQAPPSSDEAAGAQPNQWMARQALGPAASLTDTGSSPANLLAGPFGLTILQPGPYLT